MRINSFRKRKWGNVQVIALMQLILLVSNLIGCAAPPTQLATTFYNQGLSEYDQGHYDQAVASYTQAISLDPQLVANYYNRGLTYSAQAQFTLALADFSKAIELDAQMAPAYYNRGTLYQRTGQNALALADYETYLRLNPQAANRIQVEQSIRELNSSGQ